MKALKVWWNVTGVGGLLLLPFQVVLMTIWNFIATAWIMKEIDRYMPGRLWMFFHSISGITFYIIIGVYLYVFIGSIFYNLTSAYWKAEHPSEEMKQAEYRNQLYQNADDSTKLQYEIDKDIQEQIKSNNEGCLSAIIGCVKLLFKVTFFSFIWIYVVLKINFSGE